MIEQVCSRPNMYTLRGTFDEIAAYVMGYAHGDPHTPLSGEAGVLFNRFVNLKLYFPSNFLWSASIKRSAHSDKEAIELFRSLVLEFSALKDTMSEEALLLHAAATSEYTEGDAEKTFRKFDKALLTGDRTKIEPLIEKHPDAAVLWTGAYPGGVAAQLGTISENQPIRKVYTSADGKNIRLLAPGWPFEIEMSFDNGIWKINASPIISAWKKKNS